MTAMRTYEKYSWPLAGENKVMPAMSEGLITSYSWEDAGSRVNIRFPSFTDLPSSYVHWTRWSVRVVFGTPTAGMFDIATLAAPIEGACVVYSKRGVPTLVLTKTVDVPWTVLTGKRGRCGNQLGKACEGASSQSSEDEPGELVQLAQLDLEGGPVMKPSSDRESNTAC